MNFDNLIKEDYDKLLSLFEQIQKEGSTLFSLKNERYEASFFRQCAEDKGLSSLAIRLSDKLNRFKSLVKNPNLDPLDESLQDTLTDLANYAIMGLVFLRVGDLSANE